MQHVDTATWLQPLRERGLVPEGCLAAFVVGSAARGWHNERSDFDIYIVSSDEWESTGYGTIAMPLNPPRVRTEMFYTGDRKWEVTYWLKEQFEQMFAKVSWGEYNRGVVSARVLAPREELALSRLQNCLVLLGQEWIDASRRRLSESAFRSFVVARSLGAADDCVEDALGQMDAGNLESATLSARAALGFAVDALLEGQGEYGSQLPKWRPNRFRAVSSEFLSFEDYWALETMRGYDPDDPRPWINDVLTICQEIAMRVETS
ncbi:nucleotidyltransferase domain-containing protein [Streptomyces phyllanthi]|uniref:Nucleotidyltransferase domain-containing protein n=1 Tax=Streptomyces phyllanthi TaxID=1803180 RepID=A0A5N8VUF3_9ACTN|nr:nucleotidyltransferase domain-containing protein [Streptomyces phyllanthi]MPY38619.1 nucleotidyltransferase domain-containing protein [Streptomyces phyllanthi]